MTSAARRMSVRARLLVYLLVLTTAALIISGLTAFAIERARIDNNITEGLALRTEAFTELATSDDPSTGQPYASADDLMREAMIRVVASPTESAVAHIGTVARYVPSAPSRLRLEDDPQLLEAAAANATNDVVVRAVSTDVTDYRYAAVPIIAPDGTEAGVFTIATDRGALQANLSETFRVYSLVAVIALAVMGIVAWTTVGRTLRPIGVLEARARQISEHDLSGRIPVQGHDDLARLTGTFNGMLNRLEGAFADQRRLLDDASHELRTPLAIMRTNLELLEPRDPEEVTRVQRDLLEEVSMMSRLVDDLVTLAKSDRPEFVLRANEDLRDLTDTTFTRASALGDRDWRVEGDGAGPVWADAQRLTQAWLQLAANAVKFSEPGTPIWIGSSTGRTTVRVWVRDQGIGIAPEDHARVMERFHRVDPDAEGAGLGLTIVNAIAIAHGGRLELSSSLGAGSQFTIVLPKDGGAS
ncbi:sensor histidine kinase [Demequina globuliformis]|uniref:sensor histidine kinase n=1 Tax=Demequina globuliformis TaxID=676202 RepID=UPI000A041DAC|nr:HAMP domain-containing sensor histidine kinase [Demequina globuliformis]